MRPPNVSARRRPALRPLAAALALVFALDGAPLAATAAPAPMPARPDTVLVTNCDDAGPGSLRDALANVADGETVDASQLACSVISLSTGAILIGSQDVTLHGPGGHRLAVMGNGGTPGGGVLYDLGGGTLSVEGVDFAFGSKYRSDHAAHGGCIYSSGNLEVSDSHIYACGVHSGSYDASGGAVSAQGFVNLMDTHIDLCGLTTSGNARGGGVFAGGDAFLLRSTVSGCRNATGSRGYGGGVYAGGRLTVKYSTLDDNENDEASLGFGGGGFSRGGATVYWSTISGNRAEAGGGLFLDDDGSGATVAIGDSTISGNYAQSAGGVRASLPLTMHNSTVAFNATPQATAIPIGYFPGAGLGLRGSPVTITSSIVAHNVAHGQTDREEDIGGELSITIDGAANLIMDAAQPVPPDTLTDDPLLASLQDNGGLTRTHALLPGSPAIDHGDAGTFTVDQRGPGFPRVLGAGADIGAYEVDPDRIFANGFD